MKRESNAANNAVPASSEQEHGGKRSVCSDIEIRRARAGDIPRMAELLGELFILESDFAPEQDKQEHGLSALIADPSGKTFPVVAEHDGAIVGMATAQVLVSTAEGGRVGLVEDVVVEKRFRGRGIGTLLLDRIVLWARSKGLKRLQLLADRKNRRALAFYTFRNWTVTDLVNVRMKL